MGKKKKNRNKHKGGNYQNHSQNPENNFNNKQSFDYPLDNNVYDAEIIDEAGSPAKNIVTLVVVVFLALLLTVLILLTTGLLKRENLGFLNFANNFFAAEKINSNLNGGEENNDKIEFVENITLGQANNYDGTLKTFSTVKLPMLMGNYYDLDLELESVGCDRIYWITLPVKPTPAPLNATYRAMFDFDQELDFYVGNYVAKQEKLNFDYAEIENGLAKVYLTGEITPQIGDCADRLKIQLTKAALQFNTVSKVEIYLNGNLY